MSFLDTVWDAFNSVLKELSSDNKPSQNERQNEPGYKGVITNSPQSPGKPGGIKDYIAKFNKANEAEFNAGANQPTELPEISSYTSESDNEKEDAQQLFYDGRFTNNGNQKDRNESDVRTDALGNEIDESGIPKQLIDANPNAKWTKNQDGGWYDANSPIPIVWNINGIGSLESEDSQSNRASSMTAQGQGGNGDARLNTRGEEIPNDLIERDPNANWIQDPDTQKWYKGVPEWRQWATGTDTRFPPREEDLVYSMDQFVGPVPAPLDLGELIFGTPEESQSNSEDNNGANPDSLGTVPGTDIKILPGEYFEGGENPDKTYAANVSDNQEYIADPNQLAFPTDMDLMHFTPQEYADWHNTTSIGTAMSLLAPLLVLEGATAAPVAAAGAAGAEAAGAAGTGAAEAAGAAGAGKLGTMATAMGLALPTFMSGILPAVMGQGNTPLAKAYAPDGDLSMIENYQQYLQSQMDKAALNGEGTGNGSGVVTEPGGFRYDPNKSQYDYFHEFMQNNPEKVKELGWDRFGDDWHQYYTDFRANATTDDWATAIETIPGWSDIFDLAGINWRDRGDLEDWLAQNTISLYDIENGDSDTFEKVANSAHSWSDLQDYMAARGYGWPLAVNEDGSIPVDPGMNRYAYTNYWILDSMLKNKEMPFNAEEINYLFRDTPEALEFGTTNEYSDNGRTYDVDSVDDILSNDRDIGIYGVNRAPDLIYKASGGTIKSKQKSDSKGKQTDSKNGSK